MTHEIRTEVRQIAYSATGAVLYALRDPDASGPDVQRRAVCACGWRGPWYSTPEGLAQSGGRHLRRAAEAEGQSRRPIAPARTPLWCGTCGTVTSHYVHPWTLVDACEACEPPS